MSLYVDIEKKLGSFQLKAKFEMKQESFAILGASGSGKSLTLKCIAGIETPDKGVIILNDRVLFDSAKKINVPARERNVGYLFQDYALFPNMTVLENILCAIQKNHFKKKSEDEKKAHEYIARFALDGKEELYPSQLSGGQKQRAALARLMAGEPQMILLDEPFSALDNHLKWQMEQEVMKVMAAYGKDVILVSHDRNEVFRLSDRIGVMDRGEMIQVEAKKELFHSPKTLPAALLTGCKNLSRIERLENGECFATDWGIKLKLEKPEGSYVGFRAHFFEVVEGMEEHNVVECEIIKVIEDTFSMILLFRQRGNTCMEEWSTMRYEVSKDAWTRMDGKSLWLKLPTHELMILH